MPRKSTPNSYRIVECTAFLTLTNRLGEAIDEAIIDLDDLDRVLAAGRWCGTKGRKGDIYVRLVGSSIRLHRFILDAPNTLFVDHKFHNTLDCRKANLRMCTNGQNMQNRRGADSDSTSGIRNVYWLRSCERWIVQLRKDGKKYDFGSFRSLEDAAEVALKARAALFDYSVPES